MDKYELIESIIVKTGLGILGLNCFLKIEQFKAVYSRKKIKNNEEDLLHANIFIKTKTQKPSKSLNKILVYYDLYKNLSLPIIEVETNQS